MMNKCIICEKSFYNQSNLTRHKKTKHSNEDSTIDSDQNSSKTNESETSQSEDMHSTDACESSSSEEGEEEEEEREDTDIWRLIAKEAQDNDDGDFLQTFIRNVIFCRRFKDDKTFKQIKDTIQKAQDKFNMDFHEALEYAVDKRKFLIKRAICNATEDSSDNVS